MNTYLIPTTAPLCYEPYDRIFIVTARTPREAYSIAKKQLSGWCIPKASTEYEFYPFKFSHIPDYPFSAAQKDDIIISILKDMGVQHMAFFKVNWNDYTEELSKKAMKEEWSNATYPGKRILSNYMAHTFDKLMSEHKVVINKKYALFNTGLYTEFYKPIYAYQDEKNGIKFLTQNELGSLKIYDRPQRADYFKDPSLLLFNWHFPININYEHILKDINNINRIPAELQNDPNLLNTLDGAIEAMKKKVSANYKLAVPQYYENKIQLLLPLCLQGADPTLALAVTKVGNFYQGHTCLTLDMAYNNARLIAKPESNWLTAESVLSTEPIDSQEPEVANENVTEGIPGNPTEE